MNGEFWSYSVYPAFAVACCGFLIVKAWKSNAAFEYIKLFSNLLLLNLCQVVIYLVIHVSFTVATLAADIYLITAYFLFAHLLQLALHLSEHHRGDWPKYIYVIPVTLTIMHILGYMVEGYRFEGDALLHNDAEYAWGFDVFIALSSLITISTFIVNTRTANNNYLLISRNLIALFSFIPFMLGATYIIVRSTGDDPISVVYIIPTMSLWIAGVFYYITRPNIIDLTRSPRGHWEIIKLVYSAICHVDTKGQLDYFSKQWQLLTYKEKIRKYRNYSKAAKALDISESLLRKAVPLEEFKKLVPTED